MSTHKASIAAGIPAYPIPLAPTPSMGQYTYINPAIMPVMLPVPPPDLPAGAIPGIAQLMNPACVLIVQFRNDGQVWLYSSVPKNGGYEITTPVKVPAGAPVTFTFTVVVKDPNNPDAGLLIERTDDWSQPWDDEVAYVVGGSPFPFGADPVPLGGSTTKTFPLNYVEGYFTPPPTGGTKTASQLVIVGQSRKVICTIDQLGTGSNAAKSLSLWLPVGTDGQLDVTQGTASYTVKSSVTLRKAKAGNLTFMKKKQTVKKLIKAVE